jgi:hypothetical protein
MTVYLFSVPRQLNMDVLKNRYDGYIVQHIVITVMVGQLQVYKYNNSSLCERSCYSLLPSLR